MSSGIEARGRIVSRDGQVSGSLFLQQGSERNPLLVCIHGGGCNGAYFDIPGYSVKELALERGFSVLLVNRPGYGGTPVPHGDEPVARSVASIRAFIDEVNADYFHMTARLLILAHSIGGVVALMLAGSRGIWPLVGVAIHGIGDVPAPALAAAPRTRNSGKGRPPNALDANMFFGSAGTYKWDAPAKLRRVSEPWLLSEVDEIVHDWPERWPHVAAALDVPVHFRLAETEAIWETGPAVVQRMRAKLKNAPVVDADLLPEGGHLYELHKRGRELVTSQLAFLQKCSASGGL